MRPLVPETHSLPWRVGEPGADLSQQVAGWSLVLKVNAEHVGCASHALQHSLCEWVSEWVGGWMSE